MQLEVTGAGAVGLRARVIELFREERAANATEYAIVAAMIGLAILVAATAMGGQVSALFQSVVDVFAGA